MDVGKRRGCGQLHAQGRSRARDLDVGDDALRVRWDRVRRLSSTDKERSPRLILAGESDGPSKAFSLLYLGRIDGVCAPAPIARRETGVLPNALWMGVARPEKIIAGAVGRPSCGTARPPSLVLPRKGGGDAAERSSRKRVAGRGLPDRLRNAIRHRLIVRKADAVAGDEIAVTVHPS
jgi:hypothetical protein